MRLAALARRTVLLVLLGVATSVVVAWGFAIRGYDLAEYMAAQRAGKEVGWALKRVATHLPDGRTIFFASSARGLGWSSLRSIIRQDPPRSGNVVTYLRVDVSRAPPVDRFRLVPAYPGYRYVPPPPATGCIEYRFGWPWHGMWCARDGFDERYHDGEGFHQLVPIGTTRDELKVPFSRTQRGNGVPHASAIPIGFLLRGTTLNTLFYGAVWWVLLFSFGTVRHWSRRRRGVCLRCAYSREGLGAGAPCPECGRTPRA